AGVAVLLVAAHTEPITPRFGATLGGVLVALLRLDLVAVAHDGGAAAVGARVGGVGVAEQRVALDAGLCLDGAGVRLCGVLPGGRVGRRRADLTTCEQGGSEAGKQPTLDRNILHAAPPKTNVSIQHNPTKTASARMAAMPTARAPNSALSCAVSCSARTNSMRSSTSSASTVPR